MKICRLLHKNFTERCRVFFWRRNYFLFQRFCKFPFPFTRSLNFLILFTGNITVSIQWRVLGSGPYFSLGSNHKLEVLDHICERYFSLSGAHPISRYELAAHIRANNPVLYNDLIMSGLLIMRAKEVGGEIKNDEWLMHLPSYRTRERPLLLSGDYLMKGEEGTAVQVLWFHLPYVNGKKPGKEVPWERFSTGDRDRLEHVFRALLQEEVIGDDVETCLSGFSDAIDELGYDFGDVMEKKSTESVHPRINDVENLQEKSSPNDAFLLQDTFLQKRPKLNQRHQHNCIGKYPTLAQWYEPDLSKDILVDERRYAVSFVPTCLSCGKDYDAIGQPIVSIENTANHICAMCRSSPQHHNFNAALIPRIKQVMRPTLWRFYGSHSNDVRRAVWVLDTHRHGLQPYSDESAAVLEDAYLFLKYNFLSPDANEEKTESSIGGVLLSVEVSGPDGEEQQLVQFRGLSHVTAIKKTLGSAFSVFKRRVYRGGSDGKELYFDCNSSEKENKNKTGAVSIVDPIFSSLAAPLDGSETGRGENYSENFDADVDHLVLVVHGMGEMLRSVDIFGMGLPALCSIVDCCSRLRNNYAEVHAAQFSDFGNINRKSPLTHEDLASSVLGRVEYIPVEWHEAFAFQSQRLPAERDLENSQKCSSATLKDISLKTIPALRDFANDTLLDVLYFMSPHHHKIITDIVAKEMHLIVKKFQELTGFDGKISILGHSLGSIITFDILANQEGQVKLDSHTHGSQQTKKVDSEYNQGYSSGYFKHKQNQNKTIEDLEYPQLKFEVQNFFMIGSPVAVFLMIRNQHMPLSEDFSLPGCSRVFNIFHPYDPAAYRIEPLIDPQNSDVEPIIITHWKGGFRVQYQTKFMLRKLADKTKKTQKDVMEAVEARMLGMGLLDSTFDDLVEEDRNGSDDNSLQVVHCGSLNHGHRIDFMLQEKEIENANEYVFALAAHSSYWNEKDLSLFVARQIFQTGNEKGEFY